MFKDILSPEVVSLEFGIEKKGMFQVILGVKSSAKCSILQF